MANQRVKLDRGAVGVFLRGPEVRRMVGTSAERIAARSGKGFASDVWISPDRGRSGEPRAVGGVKTDSFSARRRQSRDNILVRARDAGRV